MNDVAELKQYVGVHARAQGIAGYEDLLAEIQSDDDGADSWVGVWSRSAEKLEQQGQLLEACRHYIMARFPYVDGPARQWALERAVDTFDRWRRDESDIKRLDVDLPSGRFGCWTIDLDAGDHRPLLLIMGGIVSVKEQWALMLARARELGMAGLVTEMPGAGENTLRYDADSWRMVSGALDAVRDAGGDPSRAYAMALSFSGHMALRCAMEDRRIRGMVVAGTPVSAFYTDVGWQAALPRVTVDTLAHLAGEDPSDVLDRMRGWALTDRQLAGLDIPVYAQVSLRDEIIPAADARMLRDHLCRPRVRQNDDVHGSPRHVAETGLWFMLALLRMNGGDRRRRASLRRRLAGLERQRRRLARGA
jgi:esterase FrsA